MRLEVALIRVLVSDLSKNADEQALRAAAEKTVRDEGYELAAASITIRREQSAATR